MSINLSQVRKEMAVNVSQVREEMQGGFSLTYQRIAQSEETIKHILESVIELNESLEKRVVKLETKVGTTHSI